MPPVLHIKPQEVESSEKRSKYTVCVVGCGHKGIFYANAFAQAGYQVTCTDANPNVTKKVTKGKTASSKPQEEAQLKGHLNTGQISVSSDRKQAVSQGDIIVIAIGVRLDGQKKIDYSPIVTPRAAPR
jgi:UDPglucose 6-dehydrogenase